MNGVKEGFLEEVEFKGRVGKGNSKVFPTKRESKNKKTGNRRGSTYLELIHVAE